ncbi:hypothetical protein K2173_023039 [Erythroxylum novogranatense]|uniref:Transmembrane protein n=1 Tax=Erythroxylum novogranatense TaxID=1862640 RepID=A0AAV8T836_9ROSI|nr:hypothetical protein K2173_023039 [Erythroxylum novogranatense]
MESSFSSSSSSSSISNWETLNLLVIRPILAITFVFVFLSIGWLLAWKLVLVHVPLVQEIFGLRKKPAKPKPPARRFSRYYNSSSINSRSSDSG